MALSFETARLKVFELNDDVLQTSSSSLFEKIPTILTPSVVASLPAYFHGVDSIEQAKVWLEHMLLESRLLLINTREGELIGFLFVSVEYAEGDSSVHIGYLLAEDSWGKGLATELLEAFIHTVSSRESWTKLIAGVEPSNLASIKLLKKLGFQALKSSDTKACFYEYKI